MQWLHKLREYELNQVIPHSFQYLQKLRLHELNQIIPLMQQDSTILEIGAGAGWQAISYAALSVSQGGQLVIAIYNRHWTSRIWKIIKMIFNKSPFLIKQLLVWIFVPIISCCKKTGDVE